MQRKAPPRQARRRREKVPYSLTRSRKAAGAFIGQQHSRLRLGVVRELAESGWASTNVSSVLSHAGCHFYGRILRSEHAVVLRVPQSRSEDEFVFSDDRSIRLLPPGDPHERVVVARIARVLSIEHKGERMPWLEVCFAQRVLDRHWLFLSFKMREARFYVPLGWGGWTIARRISLRADYSNVQYHLYNHRTLWLLADRWPPGRESRLEDNRDNEGEADEEDEEDEGV